MVLARWERVEGGVEFPFGVRIEDDPLAIYHHQPLVPHTYPIAGLHFTRFIESPLPSP
jgi:hypothetical protein